MALQQTTVGRRELAPSAGPPYTLGELVAYALKLGTIGFGGPVALVGYMHRDLVERRKWISEADYNTHDRIARIIDEADTVQEVSVEPAAAGLDLICEGVRLVSPDDQTATERGAFIYDALYACLAVEQEQKP